MRSSAVRKKMTRAAAIGVSTLLLAAACGKQAPGGSGEEPGGTQVGGLIASLTAGTLLVSDGTDQVRIGDRTVKFPTTVTDAAWSPDGSRIAFVDGDGNIAISAVDGSDRRALTQVQPGYVRSRPAWAGGMILFAEQRPGGSASDLRLIPGNGCPADLSIEERGFDAETAGSRSFVNRAPSVAVGVNTWRAAFQHDEPGGPEIWVHDTGGGTHSDKVGPGSDPALTADGTRLAFVGPEGQIYVREGAAQPVRVTSGADRPHRLTWMPDGRHIAYATATGIESVDSVAGSNPTILATTPGVPTFLPDRADLVSRVSGADPVAVAIAASQARWPTAAFDRGQRSVASAPAARLATPESIAGVSVIPMRYGPLLLSAGDTLDPRTEAELRRLFGDPNASDNRPTVTTMGAFSADVETAVRRLGLWVERTMAFPFPLRDGGVCGPQDVGRTLTNRVLVVANAASTVDSMIGRNLANDWGAPLLRIDAGTGLTEDNRTYLSRSRPFIASVLIVDAAGAIPADVEKQIGDLISGPLGYATSNNPTVPPLVR